MDGHSGHPDFSDAWHGVYVMRKMTEMDCSALIGPALDWAVADAIGNPAYQAIDGNIYSSNERWAHDVDYPHPRTGKIWSPTTDWSQCGPLIDGLIGMKILNDRRVRDVKLEKLEHWYDSTPGLCREWRMVLGHDGGRYEGIGETPMIAACRAILAAKAGRSILVPEHFSR